MNPENNLPTLDNSGIIESDELNEVVKMDEIPPLNDPQCEHEFAIDETDTIGDAVAYVCTKRNCGVGYFARPENKKL